MPQPPLVSTIYDPLATTPSGNTFTRAPFPGNVIPLDRLDPVSSKLIAFYPLPSNLNVTGNLPA